MQVTDTGYELRTQRLPRLIIGTPLVPLPANCVAVGEDVCGRAIAGVHTERHGIRDDAECSSQPARPDGALRKTDMTVLICMRILLVARRLDGIIFPNLPHKRTTQRVTCRINDSYRPRWRDGRSCRVERNHAGADEANENGAQPSLSHLQRQTLTRFFHLLLPTVEGEVAKAASLGIVLNAEIIFASVANHGCDSSPVVAVSECRRKVAEGCRVIAVLGQESPRFSHLCLVEAIDVNDSASANDDAGVLAVVVFCVRAQRVW